MRHLDSGVLFRIRLNEIHPSETEALRIRIKGLAEVVVATGVQTLFATAEQSLKDKGYPGAAEQEP